uniref:Uncharacterized protein n=1 Tax=Pristionchus pacificus TaxID=54126 RepID=A0A2A6BSK2_PRIPA|eukprot:PDM68919.1 hypothetical protein PRIPAC_47221 [Pristionchus pacificus]
MVVTNALNSTVMRQAGKSARVISAYLISAPDVLQIRVGSFRVEIADDEENDGDKLDCERDDGTRDHLAF